MAAFDDPRSGLDGVRGDPAPRPAVSGDMLAIFDASQMPTAVTRVADGVILFANPACLELLGWPEDEFVGRSIVEAGSWGRREDRTAIREQLAAEGTVRNLEAEITTRSGETRTVLTSISHVDVDGEPCLIGHVHDISERLRLEAELRESEDRFRQVTETIQQGFLLRELDPPEVLYVSPAVGRIFGIDLATLYDDPLALQKLVHPDDRDAVLAPWDATAQAADFECRIVRPDGETRWIRTRAEPVRVEDGRVARIAAVTEDVTAERELRDALRQNEARFRLLAEHSTDVIGRLAPDQRIEYVSPACRSVYGYEPEEMVGRFGWEFIHPDDLAEMRE